MNAKKILLFGLGFFQKSLVESISRTRGCIVVDSDLNSLESYSNDIVGIETIHGEASSILTWKKIPLDNISHIVSSLQDYDVVMEICRIAREVLKLDIPIIVLWYKDQSTEDFLKYNTKVVNPLDIGVEAINGLIDKNYSKPTNIGLGAGEIVEVSVLRRSQLTDRKMKYIQPNKWHVAMAYRDNKHIIPDGEFKLRVGDKAVIVGEPKVVENIVNILMKDTYEFPLQYGQEFAVLLDGIEEKHADEIVWFKGKTKAKKFITYDVENSTKKYHYIEEIFEGYGSKKGSVLRSFRSLAFNKECGVIAIPSPNKFTIFNKVMRFFFKKSRVPFFISRGIFPYEEIIVSLNGRNGDRLIELGDELSFLFNTQYRIVYVTPPGALKSKSDDESIKRSQSLVADFENINRTKLNFQLLEGNPVTEILRVIGGRKHILLIVAANSSDDISILSPHVSYLLAGRSCVSVLALPDEFSNE